jgi:hypothetical protein
VQDQSWPPLLNRLPDLALLLELDQEHPLGLRLRADEEFNRRCESWAKTRSATETRTIIYVPGEWGILSVRTSSDILLRAADQQGAFVAWLRDAATALKEHGILGRIVALARGATAGK